MKYLLNIKIMKEKCMRIREQRSINKIFYSSSKYGTKKINTP